LGSVDAIEVEFPAASPSLASAGSSAGGPSSEGSYFLLNLG